MFLTTALLYPLPFILVRSASFQHWNRTVEFIPLEFAFSAAGKNADVIVFGDSSAYHGIDPGRMSLELGTKVLALPANLPELSVIGDFALRQYMAADRPPRVIVFYFAPWNFDYGNQGFDDLHKFDGVEMLLRHGGRRQILDFLEAHPALVLDFPLMYYRANFNSNLFRGKFFRKQAGAVAASMGHDDSIGKFHLPADCIIPDSLTDNLRFDWVRELGRKYSSPATKVMFYAAPVPDCRNARAVVDKSYEALPAKPPVTITPSFFVEDAYYTHLYPAGVTLATRNLTEALRPVLAAPAP